MNVSAINCTPIKPQVSFGKKPKKTDDKKPQNPTLDVDDEEKLEKVSDFADAINNEVVNSSSVKKPVAAVVSVLLAGLIAYAGGKRIAQIAINGGEKLHLNLPEMLDKSLRKASVSVANVANSLKKENPVTKFDKFKNIIGSSIQHGENIAKTLYKKVAYSGVAENATVAVKQSKAFANLGGIAGIATAFPAVAAKDSNDDGVSDILQRGQNAYTGAKTKMGQVMEKAGKLSELVDLLT